MFPITDLSRADDIRMRRRRAVWLLAGIVVIPAILFSGHGGRKSSADIGDADGDVDASAQLQDFGHDATVLSATGSSLTVSLSCASSITLVPRQDQAGRVSVSTRGSRPAGGSGMVLSGDAAMVLGGSCRHGRPDLVVRAPASMPLTLVQSGSTAIRLGAFSGPVHLVQHGGGDTVIDASGPLDIVNSGGGDVSVDRLDGPLRLSVSGSGDVDIAHAHAGQVQVVDTGSGDVSIDEGRVDRLDAVMRGSGDLSIEAEVGEASVLSSNESDIKLPHVTGHFTRTILDE